MSVILRPEFPNPPSASQTSEGGASSVAPQPSMPTEEASILLLCKTLKEAGQGAAYRRGATNPADPPGRLMRGSTKEERFRRWLINNPVMERNPYAREWFENEEAYRGWDRTIEPFDKDKEEERNGDWTR